MARQTKNASTECTYRERNRSKHNASGGPRTGGKGIKRRTIVILEKWNKQMNGLDGQTPHLCFMLSTMDTNSIIISQTPKKITHTHTHLTALFQGLTRWAGTRKVKPIWILLKQEKVSGTGISWAVCRSAPCSRQTCQHPTSFFYNAGCLFCHQTNSIKALKANTKK